ncbi:MAG: peroxidase family protein, partial [Planctomycetaceae bacterium]
MKYKRRPYGGRNCNRAAQVEQLEQRTLLSAAWATADGTGNNVNNPTWGSAGIPLLRVAESDYDDG